MHRITSVHLSSMHCHSGQDHLCGKRIDMPPARQVIQTFKKALRARANLPETLAMPLAHS